MKSAVATINVPSTSEISRYLPGAHFRDSYEIPIESAGPSALEIYLGVVSNAPTWVNTLIAVRNRAVSLVGLKNLGHLASITQSKPAIAYGVGDRVGIFSILQLTEDEVILGDSDKHLDVKVSVCKLAASGRNSVAVSTVVHIHNTLGHIYMLFVSPVHKLIVPAMLKRATGNARRA